MGIVMEDYLNTSHVKVNRQPLGFWTHQDVYLNTSHVKVNHRRGLRKPGNRLI